MRGRAWDWYAGQAAAQVRDALTVWVIWTLLGLIAPGRLPA